MLFIDAFGNCRLAGETADLAAMAGPLDHGRLFRLITPTAVPLIVPWVATFGEVAVGDALLFEDADYAGPALAVNQGSAAERFDLKLDSPIRLEPA